MYCIYINDIKIVFDSPEVKEDYIKKEFKYSLNEKNARYNWVHVKQRNTLQELLDKKRLAFATRMGYGASKYNKKEWVKLEQETELELA